MFTHIYLMHPIDINSGGDMYYIQIVKKDCLSAREFLEKNLTMTICSESEVLCVILF